MSAAVLHSIIPPGDFSSESSASGGLLSYASGDGRAADLSEALVQLSVSPSGDTEAAPHGSISVETWLQGNAYVGPCSGHTIKQEPPPLPETGLPLNGSGSKRGPSAQDFAAGTAAGGFTYDGIVSALVESLAAQSAAFSSAGFSGTEWQVDAKSLVEGAGRALGEIKFVLTSASLKAAAGRHGRTTKV